MTERQHSNRQRRARASRAPRVIIIAVGVIASSFVAFMFESIEPTYRATIGLALAGKTLRDDPERNADAVVEDYLFSALETAVARLPEPHNTELVIREISVDESADAETRVASVAFDLFAEAPSAQGAERAVETSARALLGHHDMVLATSAAPAHELESARLGLEKAGAGLEDAEHELAAFERHNAAALPGLEDLNEKAVQELEQERLRLEAQLHVLESRRVELDRALRDLQRGADLFSTTGDAPLTSEVLVAAQARWAVLRGRYGSDYLPAIELGTAINEAQAAIAARVETLEAELETARVAFENRQQEMPIDHPDVVGLAHRVSALELTISGARVTGLSRRDLAEIENLARERIGIDGEITELRDQVAAAAERREEYEGRIRQAPILEQQHVVLLEQATDARQLLETQRERYAALSETMRAARSSQAGTLSVVEETQTRRLILNRSAIAAGLAAVFAVLAVTFVVARVRHKHSRVSGADIVARLQGRPPLAEIPELQGS